MLCDVRCLPSVTHNPAVSIVGENQVEFAFAGYRIPVDDLCGLTSRNVPLLTAVAGQSPALKQLDVDIVAVARHGANIGDFSLHLSNVTDGPNSITATNNIAVVFGSVPSANASRTLTGSDVKATAIPFTQLVMQISSVFSDEGWFQIDGTVTILLE